MCWIQAKSPFFAGGTPQKERASAAQRSAPQFCRLNGGLAMTTSNCEMRAVRLAEARRAQGVAAHDLEVLDLVEEQVHPGDGGGGEVDLLAVEPQRAVVAALRADAVDRLDEHAAGAAGRVVDRLAGLRVEDADDEVDDLARGEELTGLLAGLVGEVLQQVLVRLAEQVVGDVSGLRVRPLKALMSADQRRTRGGAPCCPRRRRRRCPRGCRVGLLDPAERRGDPGAEVVGLGRDLAPVAVRRAGRSGGSRPRSRR